MLKIVNSVEIFFSVASTNMMERKASHMSESNTEMKLSVKNPLPGVEEVKETEMMDNVEDNS